MADQIIELREAVSAADAVVVEIMEKQPPRQPPILTGDCKEDVRQGNEYLATVAAWEEERHEAQSKFRYAVMTELQAWDELLDAAYAEDEQRSGSRDDDAAA